MEPALQLLSIHKIPVWGYIWGLFTPVFPYFRLFRSSDPLIDFGDKDDGYVDEVHPEEATTTLIPPVGHPFRVVRITPRTGPGEMLLNEVGGEAQKLCGGGGGGYSSWLVIHI